MRGALIVWAAVFVTSFSMARAQDAGAPDAARPTSVDSETPAALECAERSADGCLCLDEALVRKLESKALAFDRLKAKPVPACEGTSWWVELLRVVGVAAGAAGGAAAGCQ